LRGAAEALGTSVDAVRKRIARGTLESEKADGKVYVWLDDGAPRSDTERLISTLEEQLRLEREAHAEARRLLAAALERIPPQLEAPQESSEPRESPQTVEDEPEGAEPHSAMGGAQEATERPPQRRKGWLAPVDKLPWWHYVLGLVATVVGTVAVFFGYYLTGGVLRAEMVLAIVMLGLPSSMGVWVGLRQRYVRVWRRVVPFGALLGVAFVSTLVFYAPDLAWSDLFHYKGIVAFRYVAFLSAIYVVAPCLLYVSGVLIGNAVQRRVTGRRSGTIPASPLSRTTSAATGSGTGWTPRQQAILGFVGTVVAALLGLFGSVIGAIVASGG
jgi:hypothetical protein